MLLEITTGVREKEPLAFLHLMNRWLPVMVRATMWAYLPIRAQNGEDGYNDNGTRLRNHRRSSGLGKIVFREALSLYCPWAIKYYHTIWGLTFHYRGLERQSRKSRNTRSNRQICPWVQNEAGQRLIELCQENALLIANTLFQQHKRDSTHGHHQMVNTEIRLIIFFAPKEGEALYSQQKQDQELTVAQIQT